MRQNMLARLTGLLLLAVVLAPMGAPAAAKPSSAAPTLPAAPAAALALSSISESEPNDDISPTDQADPIGAPQSDWAQQVRGTIGSSADVDYYKFTLKDTATSVKITLSGLTGDYDLMLASGADTGVAQGESGLEGVTDIGGSIASIGGSIASIGGSIASISANAGTSDEQIDTYLWLPGTYYVAVASNNGAYDATNAYTLDIAVDGSGLTKPAQPAPEVELRIPASTYPVSTLYVINSARMGAVYGSTQTLDVKNKLNALATRAMSFPASGGPAEYGYILDLANLQQIGRSQTVAQIYAEWDANPTNPLYANKVARLIDNLIKAASDSARKGRSCPPNTAACPAPTMFYDGGAQTANATTPFPNVKYIVLVGGDNLLPFMRVPDLTSIANEADYATYLKSVDSLGVISPSSPQGAALKSRMLLTDNAYGSDRPLRFQGFPLFAPNRAVGRLVETPEDILRYLNRAAFNSNYTIDMGANNESPPPSFISGYDFLSDEAAAISQTIALGTATPPAVAANIVSLINDGWNRGDLEGAWFGSDLTASSFISGTGIFSDTAQNYPYAVHANSLFSLNSHFDHWQILPAKGTAGNFPARRIVTPNYAPDSNPGGYFYGTLGYSVGCHSGYNVIDQWVSAATGGKATYAADFAQGFGRQAGNWIGNTGYGYGSADGIDYSERLALLLTQELMRDVQIDISGTPTYVGSSIGLALAHAKQRYLRNAVSLSAYDAKALTVMTLYGLPFIHVITDSPLAPPPEEPRVGPGGGPVPAESTAPSSALPNSFGRLERTITVTISPDQSNYVTVARTGSKLLELGPSDFSVQDSFVQAGFVAPTLRVFSNNQIGRPSLPTFAYDIGALNSLGSKRLAVRDVVFLGGDYAPLSNFNPQITQIVTETDSPIIDTDDEPNFAAGAGVWYPATFFSHSSVGDGDDQRDQLIAAAAQFRADANGVTGQLRGYTRMVFRVFYTDPAAAGATQGAADKSGPQIESVHIDQTGSGFNALAAATTSVQVVATVSDDGGSGMDGVSGVYVLNGDTWKLVTFTRPNPAGAPRRWVASIPLSPGQVRVIVSATDRAGNVSYYTAKGSFSLLSNRVFLPLVRR